MPLAAARARDRPASSSLCPPPPPPRPDTRRVRPRLPHLLILLLRLVLLLLRLFLLLIRLFLLLLFHPSSYSSAFLLLLICGRASAHHQGARADSASASSSPCGFASTCLISSIGRLLWGCDFGWRFCGGMLGR
eukprot:6221322-Pyramimonas_sp.AAC.1